MDKLATQFNSTESPAQAVKRDPYGPPRKYSNTLLRKLQPVGLGCARHAGADIDRTRGNDHGRITSTAAVQTALNQATAGDTVQFRPAPAAGQVLSLGSAPANVAVIGAGNLNTKAAVTLP